MIIWSGRGAAVPIVTFVSLLATEFATRAYFRDDHYYQQHGWPKLAGFLLAAVIVWMLSIRRADELTAVFPHAATTSFFSDRDTLFFVRVRFWPLILSALGVAFYFYRE
jgi:hypothetical protein